MESGDCPKYRFILLFSFYGAGEKSPNNSAQQPSNLNYSTPKFFHFWAGLLNSLKKRFFSIFFSKLLILNLPLALAFSALRSNPQVQASFSNTFPIYHLGDLTMVLTIRTLNLGFVWVIISKCLNLFGFHRYR